VEKDEKYKGKVYTFYLALFTASYICVCVCVCVFCVCVFVCVCVCVCAGGINSLRVELTYCAW